MFRHLSICVALAAFAAGPVYAQKQEAVLQHIEVPGTDFNLALAVPKPGAGALPDLGNTPEALVVHLHGGALAVVFDDAGDMMTALDFLKSPVGAFHVGGKGNRSPQPVALYIVPKGGPIAVSGEMTNVQWVENERWPALVPNPSDAPEIISRAQ